MSSRPASGGSSSRSSSKKSKGKRWEPLVLPSDDVLDSTAPDLLHEMCLPAGYTLRFFPHDMRHMYTAPSKHIHLTRGVLDFIREYNQLGPNKTKTKLFLCSMFERTDSCENGFMCREVHCGLKVSNAKLRAHVAPRVTVPDEKTNPLEENQPDDDDTTFVDSSAAAPVAASQQQQDDDMESLGGSSQCSTAKGGLPIVDPDEDELVSTAVHMRSAPEDAHPRLPPGVNFRLALPNMQSPVDVVPSEKLFVTKGAKDYYDQIMRGETPTMNMQHCAHFSKNGMCCFGSDCQFVHVAQYRRTIGGHDTESSGMDSGSDKDESRSRSSSVSSRTSSAAGGRPQGVPGKRNSGLCKEGLLDGGGNKQPILMTPQPFGGVVGVGQIQSNFTIVPPNSVAPPSLVGTANPFTFQTIPGGYNPGTTSSGRIGPVLSQTQQQPFVVSPGAFAAMPQGPQSGGNPMFSTAGAPQQRFVSSAQYQPQAGVLPQPPPPPPQQQQQFMTNSMSYMVNAQGQPQWVTAPQGVQQQQAQQQQQPLFVYFPQGSAGLPPQQQQQVSPPMSFGSTQQQQQQQQQQFIVMPQQQGGGGGAAPQLPMQMQMPFSTVPGGMYGSNFVAAPNSGAGMPGGTFQPSQQMGGGQSGAPVFQHMFVGQMPQ